MRARRNAAGETAGSRSGPRRKLSDQEKSRRREGPERSGYLLKDRVGDPAVLVDTLRRLAEGETVVDPAIVSRLLSRRRAADPVGELSDREREVLALVAEGLSNAEIGRRLFITERTVEAHVKQIFQKLGIGQAAETNPARACGPRLPALERGSRLIGKASDHVGSAQLG